MVWIDGDLVFVEFEKQMGWVLMLSVSDTELAEQKIGLGLDFVTSKMAEYGADNPMMAMMAIRRTAVTAERLEGFESLSIGMSPKPVVWGAAADHLIFASSPEAVLRCLDVESGDHPGLSENKRVMAEIIVPDGPFATVSLNDRRELGEELSQVLGMVSMGISMAGMQATEPQQQQLIAAFTGILSKLMPVVKEIDFIESTAALKTFDGSAWTVKGVTHYVGSEAIE